ncbi:PDZ domain-containing protein [Roseibacillus ishigakijimensis]|uniref:PDZ domain-containing protein n=1 Tax=Roseibacillus ishigakijimensis TaxID=454146 RepID=A0A934RRD4_9BACT|nr:PDZ domain-containing protein [Roseibacillus ishigakijimensis]MBK1834236.1 PDZ domain-containing protein [Roseibacillus ishigakijimensis]
MNQIGRAVLFLSLAPATSLWSVERPSHLDETPHELQTDFESDAPGAGEEAITSLPEAVPPVPEKKVAIVEALPVAEERRDEGTPYLGVGSKPVDELVASHLGLSHGIVVIQVHEGSGAFKAGLRKNDILLSFDGRELRTPLDLRDAVRARGVGDEVTVAFLRKGEESEARVALEARPEGLPGFVPPKVEEMGQLQEIWPGGGELPAEAREEINRLREMLEKDFNDVDLGLRLNEILEGELPQGEGQVDLEIGAESSVTWSDGQGTITLKTRSGESEVKVRDHDGRVIFEGPWQTDGDKAAASPEVRERIESMGIRRKGNHLKFWMNQFPGNR